MKSLLVATAFLALTSASAFAAPPDKSDHPLISAYEGAKAINKDVKEFDEYTAFTGVDVQTGAPTGPSLEGKVTKIVYKNPKDRSTLEQIRNYEAALKKEGAEIIHSCNQDKYECVEKYAQGALGKHSGISAISNTAGRYIIGKLNREDSTAYIAVAVGPSFTNIHVVEVQAMDEGMVKVNAEALGKGIDADGYVIVEGIYFDTDKATLKPESTPALQEIAKLMASRPTLNVYVVGHTDMQGALAHNMQLSESRAKSVVAALTNEHKIAAARLEGHGVGPLSPQSSNSSDSGRGLNRRVVLVAR